MAAQPRENKSISAQDLAELSTDDTAVTRSALNSIVASASCMVLGLKGQSRKMMSLAADLESAGDPDLAEAAIRASHLATEAASGGALAARTLLHEIGRVHVAMARVIQKVGTRPFTPNHFDIQHSHIETDRMDAEQTAERLGAQSPPPTRELFPPVQDADDASIASTSRLNVELRRPRPGGPEQPGVSTEAREEAELQRAAARATSRARPSPAAPAPASAGRSLSDSLQVRIARKKAAAEARLSKKRPKPEAEDEEILFH